MGRRNKLPQETYVGEGLEYDTSEFKEDYGTPRHSGRYPWGSGENPYQGDENFQKFLTRNRQRGKSDTDIAKSMGISTTKLRAMIAISGENAVKYRDSMIYKLHDKGYNNSAIARQLRIPDTTVGNVLRRENEHKSSSVRIVADTLKKAVEEQKYIDVGHGSEVYIGSSKDKLRNAVALLEEEGYEIQLHYQTQMGTKKPTTLKVLCPKGTSWAEVEAAKRNAEINYPNYHFEDRDYKNPHRLETPTSVDSKRIEVVFGDQKLPDGTYGKDRDGLIEIRRGCEDLNLGKNHYAQVRIAVDGTHYLKGVAVYNDNLPKGIDIRYNVSKPSTMPLKSDDKSVETVFKRMKPDPVTNNPFGASIEQDDDKLHFVQVHYQGKDGKQHLSALNIVNEQGTWNEWSRNLPSQFLSKQTIPLATKQLKLDAQMRHDDFEEIMSITNSAVKKNLLNSFADNCDSAACHLKAAAMPRQATHLILPFPELKPNEIYAPNYKNGERVVLVRFPHAGRFELAELTVNNRYRHAKEVIGGGGEEGTKNDAVGIHPQVAERLSGADFDGDTVLVIPNNNGMIKTHSGLKDLDGFADILRVRYKRDPKEEPRHMTPHEKGIQMGLVSNLITDMTLMGAPESELARAVKHSMVVIDAEKHDLDWRRSLRDNNIEQLFVKYQKRKQGGASTLISRSTSPQEIPQRTAGEFRIDPKTGKTKVYYVDPKTGEKLWRFSGRMRSKPKLVEAKDENGKPIIDPKTGRHVKLHVLDENGKQVWEKVPAMEESQKMYVRKDGSNRTDAMELSSGTKMEKVYGEYANTMKALANKARLEASRISIDHANPVARKMYIDEVRSLDNALNIAKQNAPLERKAQSLAAMLFSIKKKDNPELEYDQDKKSKAESQCLEEARYRIGAKKTNISITDKQWEAIQAGAISGTKLEEILKNTDVDALKKRALPRTPKGISPAKLATAKMRINNGYSAQEVADSLGISVDTLYRALDPKRKDE